MWVQSPSPYRCWLWQGFVAIALPSQSIVTEKDTSQPITRRQLTFNDLTSHLKHYNAGTRKGAWLDIFLFNISHSTSDALIGLRELFDNNWDLMKSCLTSLINALVRLIGDEVSECIQCTLLVELMRNVGCQCSKAAIVIFSLAVTSSSLSKPSSFVWSVAN